MMMVCGESGDSLVSLVTGESVVTRPVRSGVPDLFFETYFLQYFRTDHSVSSPKNSWEGRVVYCVGNVGI
jgi:hypothetical protein